MELQFKKTTDDPETYEFGPEETSLTMGTITKTADAGVWALTLNIGNQDSGLAGPVLMHLKAEDTEDAFTEVRKRIGLMSAEEYRAAMVREKLGGHHEEETGRGNLQFEDAEGYTASTLRNLGSLMHSAGRSDGFLSGIVGGLGWLIANRTCDECREAFMSKFVSELGVSVAENVAEAEKRNEMRKAVAGFLGSKLGLQGFEDEDEAPKGSQHVH